MLDFIERYHLDRDEIKFLPRSLDQINDLLKSEYLSSPYLITKGNRRGKYVVTDYNQPDQLENPTLYSAPSLFSACSTIYSLILEKYPVFATVDFDSKNKIINSFPFKYRKLVKPLIEVLFEIEPDFAVNCQLKSIDEPDSRVFAYLVHDGSPIYDQISYRSEGYSKSFLYNYLRDRFEVQAVETWSTKLILKEEVVSSQEKWNKQNKDTLAAASAKYAQKTFTFTPTPENLALIKELRLEGEGNTELMNRILSASL